MNTPDINLDCYAIAVDNTSKSATLKTTNPAGCVIDGFNDSTTAVFIVAGATAPTAVFPTSASTPVKGQVIGPKRPFRYQLSKGDVFVSAIQAVAGTGNFYFSVVNG